MTVQTQKNTIQHLAIEGQDTYSYDFIILSENDAVVLLDSQVYLGGYQVIGIGDDSGTIILDDPIAQEDDGKILTIARLMDMIQDIDYGAYDGFPAETHEKGLDRGILIAQQTAERVSASLRFPVGDEGDVELPDVDDRREKFLYFDENGDASVVEADPDAVSVLVIGVEPDSDSMLLVQTHADPQHPNIGVNNINLAGGILKLTEAGDYPEHPNLPAGGLPLEVLANTPVLVAGVLIDDGSIQAETDSSEMLRAYRQSLTEEPFGFFDAIAVLAPNQANRLVQVDEFGQIPSSLLRTQGIRNRGIFRGDDLCDKPGDDPGDCVAPDSRNPSQRFTGLDYAPGTDPDTLPNASFRAGDFFAITIQDPETNGTMLLFSEVGQQAPAEIIVNANDGIVFIPQVIDPDDGITILIQHGWYHNPGQFDTTVAEFVSLNTAGYLFIPIGNNNVQLAFNFIDDALANFNSTQVAHILSGVMVNSSNVEEAINQLDALAFPRVGGTLTGDLAIVKSNPVIRAQITGAGELAVIIFADVAGQQRMRITYNDTNSDVRIERFSATGVTETSLSLSNDGNVSVNGVAPTADNQLTRKDYVDGLNAAQDIIIGNNTTAAATAQSAANAANANANTRKLETDFIRSGDRLDINNVRTT